MKKKQLTTMLLSLMLCSSLPVFAGDKPSIPANPALQPGLQQPKLLTPAQSRAANRLLTASVRPTRAEHSAHPTQNWCAARDATTIGGRVSLYYNYPIAPDGRQLNGVLIVNTPSGGESRTPLTIFPGTNRLATSNPINFRWQDACPPARVSVRLMAQDSADTSQFFPVMLYAMPDRSDHPTWY